MKATIYALPSLPLDANGLPRGHQAAMAAAAKELAEFINELPESGYHLGPCDGDLATERMIHRYFITLRRTV